MAPLVAAAAAVSAWMAANALAAVVINAVVDIGLSLAVGAIASLLMPKPGLKSTLQVSLSANDPRRIIVGRAATAGALVTFQTYGTNNEYIILIFRLCDHPIAGLAGQIDFTGNIAYGGNVISSVSSLAGLEVGMPIGVGTAGQIPQGAWITGFPSASEVAISAQCTASPSGITGGTFVAGASVYYAGQPQTLGGSGQVPAFYADGQDNCWITAYTGGWDQSANADMVGNSGGRWTSDTVGRGVSYVEVRARADATAFPSGIAQLFEFVFVVNGISLYDRRFDSGVGGSGSCREDDTSTWLLSANSCVIAENLLRGIRVEDTAQPVGSRTIDTLCGINLQDADLPFANQVAGFNACDVAVPLLAGGTEPAYQCNGVITCEQTFETVFGDVLATCAGRLLQSPGRFIVIPGVAQTAVRTFTNLDIRLDGPNKYTNDVDLDTIANAVVGQFADPASMYTPQPLPVRRSLTDEASDGPPGVPTFKPFTLDLSFVTSVTQGQRVQEIQRRRQRQQATAQWAFAPENLDLEAVDWITVEHDVGPASLGQTFTFEVTQSDGKADAEQSMMVALDLQQTDATVYGWTPSVDELSRTIPGYLPSAAFTGASVLSLTAAVTTITSSIEVSPAIAVSRAACNDITVYGVRYQYSVHGLPAGAAQVLYADFDLNPSTETGTIDNTLTAGILGGFQYDVQAAYLQNPPQPLSWSGVVTTSTATAGTIANLVTNQAPAATEVMQFVQTEDPTTWQNGVAGAYAVPNGATWFDPATGATYMRQSGSWVASSSTSAGAGIQLLLSQTLDASGAVVCPAGSYGHVSILTNGKGGVGNGAVSKSGNTDFGGGGGGGAIYINFAVTPGVTVLNWAISSAGQVTVASTGLSMVANPGADATSSGSGAGGTASGGTTNYTGHNGGLTDTWDGGGCATVFGAYTDNTTDDTPGSLNGQGGAGGALSHQAGGPPGVFVITET